MTRKVMRLLMRQQSRATIHKSHCIDLWRGGGGLGFQIFSIPPTASVSRNF